MRKTTLIAVGLIALAAYACCVAASEVDRASELM